MSTGSSLLRAFPIYAVQHSGLKIVLPCSLRLVVVPLAWQSDRDKMKDIPSDLELFDQQPATEVHTMDQDFIEPITVLSACVDVGVWRTRK